MPLTSALVKQLALDAGFDLSGVSGVGEFPELDFFPKWIDQGNAGDMRYLETRNDGGNLKRASLKNVAPWAKSVIICALNYNSSEPYSTEATDPTRGWISRYAWSRRDYHDVLVEKLRRLESQIAQLARDDGHDFRSWCYVDTGPVIERVYAKYAGIGWIAKNTCIINQQLGSWLFLGVILTSLSLTPDLPTADRCGTCTRCIDACPTQAFPTPYQLDATRCISYLTIEKRGPIPEDLRAAIGNNIYGCDICQDVCPWNNRMEQVSLQSPPPALKGHGFVRFETKSSTFCHSEERSDEESLSPLHSEVDLKGHGFSRAGNTSDNFGALAPEEPSGGAGLQACAKDALNDGASAAEVSPQSPSPALKGHGFSRAGNAFDNIGASAPEEPSGGAGLQACGNAALNDGALAPEVRSRPISTEPSLAPRPELINPSLDWLASMDIEEFRRVFRGSPIKRAKFSGVRRNVVTAMGNSGRLEFVPRLQELARDEDATVAEHAQWALRQLGITAE